MSISRQPRLNAWIFTCFFTFLGRYWSYSPARAVHTDLYMVVAYSYRAQPAGSVLAYTSFSSIPSGGSQEVWAAKEEGGGGSWGYSSAHPRPNSAPASFHLEEAQ